MLVVLAIVGILAVAGGTLSGDRQSGAVLRLLDELEGALSNAHHAAVTGRNVAIVTWGVWNSAPGEAVMVMAHGDATLLDTQSKATADRLLANLPPDGALGDAGQTVAVHFRFLGNDTAQRQARIVTIGSAQWTSAMLATAAGTTNQDINGVTPFLAGLMAGPVTDANALFLVDPDPAKLLMKTIRGSSSRFNNTFIIPVVGTTSLGEALPGGPMGLIVVLANGGTIFKFYNPGVRNSDGKWRRL